MKALKEFAEKLNGRQYLKETNKEIEAYAIDNGIVIVYGQSDDLMELRGAIDDELDCWDGGEFWVSECGTVASADYVMEHNGEHTSRLEAIWCPKGTDYSWGYETDIPHETFDIMEDDEPYCKGIVFYLKDLKPKKTNFDKITESVESLAGFMVNKTRCYTCPIKDENGASRCQSGKMCKDVWLEWLQQEAE